MSHRKFEHPRCGHLGFLPRKRCRTTRGRIRSFPKDVQSEACHLTGFMGYKAGMSHIVREVARPGSKLHKKDVVESVSVIETPPMNVVGVVAYVRTPRGLRCLSTAFAQHLSESFRRAYYKNWYASKKKAFTKYVAEKKYTDKRSGANAQMERMKKADVIRVILHTTPGAVRLGRKRCEVMEAQVNGGDVAAKLAFAAGLLEKQVNFSDVFSLSEHIDTIAVTRGHGFEGVTHRWGVTRLPRKTHKGLRKVACIGPWHPSRVGFTVPRAGQRGFHKRTEINKKVYRIGKADDERNGSCPADLTAKTINPMGGFPHYGFVKNDFVIIKGSVPGPIKRPLTFRKSLIGQTSRRAQEEIELKFIDTSSKQGHGRFQTSAEKRKYMGVMKKDILKDPSMKKENTQKKGGK